MYPPSRRKPTAQLSLIRYAGSNEIIGNELILNAGSENPTGEPIPKSILNFLNPCEKREIDAKLRHETKKISFLSTSKGIVR